MSRPGLSNMKRDTAGGILLIAAAASGALVMVMHPTAHDLMNADSGPRMAHVNVMVHSLALFVTPIAFLGLVGLWRRLEGSQLATAALVAYGWGLVAIMGAAVASGFVAPGVTVADGSTTPGALLHYTGLWNQGFANVDVVGTSVGILLFSIAILTRRAMQPWVAIFGALVGLLIPCFLFIGHLKLDVHGFGIVMFAQSAWLIWIGVLLCSDAPERPMPQVVSPSQ